MRQFSIALIFVCLAAGNALAAIPLLNSTMTIPYPATATGNAVDLTVNYTSTSYTSGSKVITATGSPFTESASGLFSQTFSAPSPAAQITPGGSESLTWTMSVLPLSYESNVDTAWNTEWVQSYSWSGIADPFTPMSFATASSGGTTQLQFVNQMPATAITYSKLSLFNQGATLISNGSGSIPGGTSANILTPFSFDSDFTLSVTDDFTGVQYDIAWYGTAATPEPSSLFLAAPAVALLWWRRRRKAV